MSSTKKGKKLNFYIVSELQDFYRIIDRLASQLTAKRQKLKPRKRNITRFLPFSFNFMVVDNNSSGAYIRYKERCFFVSYTRMTYHGTVYVVTEKAPQYHTLSHRSLISASTYALYFSALPPDTSSPLVNISIRFLDFQNCAEPGDHVMQPTHKPVNLSR